MATPTLKYLLETAKDASDTTFVACVLSQFSSLIPDTAVELDGFNYYYTDQLSSQLQTPLSEEQKTKLGELITKSMVIYRLLLSFTSHFNIEARLTEYLAETDHGSNVVDFDTLLNDTSSNQ